MKVFSIPKLPILIKTWCQKIFPQTGCQGPRASQRGKGAEKAPKSVPWGRSSKSLFHFCLSFGQSWGPKTSKSFPRAPGTTPSLHFYRISIEYSQLIRLFLDNVRAEEDKEDIEKRPAFRPFCFVIFWWEKHKRGSRKAEGKWIWNK